MIDFVNQIMMNITIGVGDFYAVYGGRAFRFSKKEKIKNKYGFPCIGVVREKTFAFCCFGDDLDVLINVSKLGYVVEVCEPRKKIA